MIVADAPACHVHVKLWNKFGRYYVDMLNVLIWDLRIYMVVMHNMFVRINEGKWLILNMLSMILISICIWKD